MLKKMKKRIIASVLMLALVGGIYVPAGYVGAAAYAVAAEAETSQNWATGYIYKDNKEFNRLVDENYAKLMANPNGYEELRIPKSVHGIGRDRISQNAHVVGDKLIAAGYDAYVIGGCMRDYILGKGCDDFDLVTNASLEEQKKLFGDELRTHETETGRVFAYLYINEERIDLATYQNIPKEYHGKDRIPDFDIENYSMTSNSVVFDSFQRDLTMNAIYYDLKTEDMVDFHGGIHDIRENIIKTNVGPDMIWSIDAVAAIRSIRFKAKYGAAYSDECEKEMRDNGTEYLARLSEYDARYQMGKMFTGGYSKKCFDIMVEYGVLKTLLPELGETATKSDYIKYVDEELETIDAKRSEDGTVLSDEVFDVILWPTTVAGIKKVKAAKKGFTVTWNKVGNATGYEVRYSLKKNMKNAKKVKTKKLKATIKNLKAKKKYYVQVFAYRKYSAGSIYNKASQKKQVKSL